MSLTPEQVEAVQQVLARSGCMMGAPSKTWTAQAMEGLKQYQISLGVNYPACTFMPDNFAALSAEMKEAVEGKPAPKAIETVKAEDPVVPVETVAEPVVAPAPVKVDTAMRFPKKGK